MLGIRFLLNSNCNYNCFFCHHEGYYSRTRNQPMSVDSYVYLYQTLQEICNLRLVTLSGGEPLLYPSICCLVEELKLAGCTLKITTNGYHLEKVVSKLSLIDKFNISLHSLNENEYNAVTGTVNCLNKVKRNINQLRQKFPDVSLSINVTLLPGINNNPITIGGLIDYAVSLRAGIKLIAKYTDSDHDDKVFQNIIKILTSRGFQLKNGSLRKIRYNNGLIDLYLTRVLCDAVEFSSNKQTFCQDNNDIIVAEGTKLLTCRKNNYYIDIEEALRQRDTKMLQKKIAKCISLLGSYCGKENSCGYQEKGNN